MKQNEFACKPTLKAYSRTAISNFVKGDAGKLNAMKRKRASIQ